MDARTLPWASLSVLRSFVSWPLNKTASSRKASMLRQGFSGRPCARRMPVFRHEPTKNKKGPKAIGLRETLSLFVKEVFHSVEAVPRKLRYAPHTPEFQKAGKLLADGYFACLWSLLGDLDYLTAALGLPRYSLAKGCCSLCQCTLAGEHTWTNFQPNAPWTSTMWQPSAWRAWPGRSQCPIFELDGCSCATAALDWMHCKYLGLDQYMHGSTLHLLCHYVMRGTPQENIAALWGDIQEYYKANNTPVRYRHLNRLRMFDRASKYPKLRGKAAEIRYLSGAVLHAFSKHMNERLLVHREIKLMHWLNHRLEIILSEYRSLWSSKKLAARCYLLRQPWLSTLPKKGLLSTTSPPRATCANTLQWMPEP